MESLIQNSNFYEVFSTILTIAVSIAIPIISSKYSKLLKILHECRALADLTLKACEDRKISADELKQILHQITIIIDKIRL